MTTKKRARKTVLIVILGAVAAAALVFVGLMLYGQHQMSKIPAMSFEDCLNYTTSGSDRAVITVGVIKDGKADWTVYGKDGAVLPKTLHTYEIGSLTKTVTASMVMKLVDEGKMSLDAPISDYLELPARVHYPTIRQLLTHTSGYSSYYFESAMIGNFFGGKNSFYGIGDSSIYNTLKNTEIADKQHKFDYSNFGYAALGLILEKVTGTEFTRLCDDYLHDELGLANSRISDGNGDLGKLWDWQPGDTYMSAGAVLSDIEDMLKYAQAQLDGFSENHESLAVIDTVNENYRKMGINMDEIGAAWLIDSENGFVWHNGGTGNYNSYLGFCEDTKTAVVVLSNLPPSYKIPATVLGLKKLQSLQ